MIKINGKKMYYDDFRVAVVGNEVVTTFYSDGMQVNTTFKSLAQAKRDANEVLVAINKSLTGKDKE